MYRRIADKLARGEIIILDGGTGTDIQRRGQGATVFDGCCGIGPSHIAAVSKEMKA